MHTLHAKNNDKDTASYAHKNEVRRHWILTEMDYIYSTKECSMQILTIILTNTLLIITSHIS